jgi:hypothetical protein
LTLILLGDRSVVNSREDNQVKETSSSSFKPRMVQESVMEFAKDKRDLIWRQGKQINLSDQRKTKRRGEERRGEKRQEWVRIVRGEEGEICRPVSSPQFCFRLIETLSRRHRHLSPSEPSPSLYTYLHGYCHKEKRKEIHIRSKMGDTLLDSVEVITDMRYNEARRSRKENHSLSPD